MHYWPCKTCGGVRTSKAFSHPGIKKKLTAIIATFILALCLYAVSPGFAFADVIEIDGVTYTYNNPDDRKLVVTSIKSNVASSVTVPKKIKGVPIGQIGEFGLPCELSETITSLTASNNSALKRVVLRNNNLTTLDVSNNSALDTVECSSCHLITLDVSNDITLREMLCGMNNLTNLDLSSNRNLQSLSVSSNDLVALDISNNPVLGFLCCNHNKLTALDVSSNPGLKSLICSDNKLTALDVSNNSGLSSLVCKNNCLTLLDVSNLGRLEDLQCSDNNLAYLDIAGCTQLAYLYCSNNRIKDTTALERWLDSSSNHAGKILPQSENNDPLHIEDASALVSDQVYKGSAHYPQVIVKYGSTILKEGQDYTLEYKNNVSVGTATVAITGIGDYAGSKNATFKINPEFLSFASVSQISDQSYTGSALTPKPVVKLGSTTLKEGTDYALEYNNNMDVGSATITIKGTGNYTGSKDVTFKINPASSNNSSTAGDSDNSSSASTSTSKPQENVSSATDAQTPDKAPRVQGSWKKSGSKWWYSYNASTKRAQGNKAYPSNEWVSIRGKCYHFDSRGYMHKDWCKSESNWYYLGADGAMKTGWAKVKNKWYYLNSDGIMQTGKKTISNKVYYLTSSGAMKTGWNKENNKWFYYNGGGDMAKGWKKVGKTWYYLNSDGVMQTGKKTISGKTYYLNSNGAMKTGWNKENGKWFYYNKSGAMQKGKWVGNYYLDSNGVMATNTWVDNDRYYVDANGKWVRGAKR